MMPPIDLGPVWPMATVAAGVLLLPLAEVLLQRRKSVLGTTLTRERRSNYLAALSTLVLGAAFVITLNSAPGSAGVFNPNHPMISMDRMSQFLNATVLLSARSASAEISVKRCRPRRGAAASTRPRAAIDAPDAAIMIGCETQPSSLRRETVR